MVVESLAIIAVVLVMAAMFAKSGRYVFGSFTLPLIGVPVFHLIGMMLRMYGSLLYFDIAGLLLGAALCFLFSRAFLSKRGRFTYLLFCVLFLVALFIAYRIN